MISFHLLHTSLQHMNSSTRGSWQNTTSRTSQGSQFKEGSSDSTSVIMVSGRRTETIARQLIIAWGPVTGIYHICLIALNSVPQIKLSHEIMIASPYTSFLWEWLQIAWRIADPSILHLPFESSSDSSLDRDELSSSCRTGVLRSLTDVFHSSSSRKSLRLVHRRRLFAGGPPSISSLIDYCYDQWLLCNVIIHIRDFPTRTLLVPICTAALRAAPPARALIVAHCLLPLFASVWLPARFGVVLIGGHAGWRLVNISLQNNWTLQLCSLSFLICHSRPKTLNVPS